MTTYTARELAKQLQALNRETVDGNNSIEYDDIGKFIDLACKLAHAVITKS